MVKETMKETGERQGVVTRIAVQLGLGSETLRHWVKQAQIDKAQRNLEGLQKTREMVTIRRDYYASRPFLSSGETSALDWITDGVEPVNSEFRDDRFSAAFDRSADSSPVFTIAYVVRAVSPGRYVLPQAKVEDMYRPDRFGRTATGAIEITAR